MKKVSVIIPVYNVEKYLAKCLESVINQTYSNLEIILVDDGSTDSSGKICDEFASQDNRICVIHKENGGVSLARNIALERATGEYIAFVDSDDYVEKKHISQLIELVEEGGAELQITGHSIIHERKDEIIIQNKNGKKCLLEMDEALKLLFKSKYYCGFLWNKLYLTKIIREYQLQFSSDISIAEDLLFNVQYILKIQHVFYDPISTYNYVQHIGSATNRQELTNKKLSAFKAYELIILLCEKSIPSISEEVKAIVYNLSIHYLYSYYATKLQDKEILRLLKNYIRTYFKYFIKSKNYKLSYKAFGGMARFSAKLYYVLRKIVKRG